MTDIPALTGKALLLIEQDAIYRYITILAMSYWWIFRNLATCAC
jgi:hypothetical protein